MGAMADAIVQYAQPLLDDSDGGEEQVTCAFNIATACWNLAIMPHDLRDKAIDQMQSTTGMSDADFAQFRHADHPADDPAS
jgi:hypothetical protein